jgi:predicted RNase H-like nuclease
MPLHVVDVDGCKAGWQALIGVWIPTRREAMRMCSGAGADDVLDALVAAWTAWRHARGLSERAPESSELDPRGLRMEMVY